uniref:centromere protein U isoform X2 n=1 Tax=Pristiophorus japonicus TaxID=55135 RepID=UPI00398EB35F
MRKSKGASTLKGSRLQASKDARSKRDRGNQTNKGQTPAQRNIAKSPGLKHPQLSPNLSCILRNSQSQGDDEHEDDYGNPLHSTAVFSGESELNDKGNEKGEKCPVQSTQGKSTQQSVPLAEKIGTEKCALTRISEGVEAEEREANTGSANDEASDENAMEPVKKAESKRAKLKTVSSSQPSKASKRSKDIPSQTGAVKNPSGGNSGIKQRAVSASATKKSLGKTRASISTQKKQSNKRAGASAAHSRDVSFHAESCTEISRQNNKSYGRKRKKSLVSRTSVSNVSPNSSASRFAAPEASPPSVKIWCPEGMKRLTKDVTELDVVLDAFEEIVTEYKQEVQLKHLRKEYSELSQKKSDLQLATQFMTGFKQLKTQYIEHRNKNPCEKETYDIFSFPAQLIEARGILGAEKQLQIINTKLQQSLDKN